MNHVWSPMKGKKGLLKKIAKQKVTHVWKTYGTYPWPYMVWSGELESGEFFRVILDGILAVDIEEREMLIKHDKVTAMAFIEEMRAVAESTSGDEKFNQIVLAHTLGVSDLVNKITFEEVMEFLKWSYASPTVEMGEFLS